jgi:hypothetical protein
MIYQDMWTYSYNGEDYDSYEYFDTKEEAIEYVENDFTVGVWIGQVDYDFKPEIDADRVIEEIQNDAYRNSVEWGDTYLEDVTQEHEQELQEELQKALDKWIDKHNYHPNFFSIKNSFYCDIDGSV